LYEVWKKFPEYSNYFTDTMTYIIYRWAFKLKLQGTQTWAIF
jgi:hypothetical protein